MILVAGLAVAVLAGIAAAFYFSIRPRGSPVRAARPGGTGADRRPGSRSRTSHPPAAGSGGSARQTSPSRRAAGHTGLGRQDTSVLAPAPTVPVSATAAGRVDGTPGELGPESQLAAYLPDPADTAKTPRSRRRPGWRKGADVDQELWPTEAFGGVTDEQFWDNLAADKPLATTARTAQADSGPRRKALSAVPPLDGRGGLPDARLDWPATRTAPPATRTALGGTPAAPGATPTAPGATPTAPAVTGAAHAAHQPAGSGGLPRGATGGLVGNAISLDEDPLTSPAYCLRPKGAVDGRSYRSSPRSRDLSWEQYEAAVSQTTQAFSLADTRAATGRYPGGVPFCQSDVTVRSGNSMAGKTRPGAHRFDPLRPDGSWPGSAGSSGSAGTVPTPAYRPGPGSADVGTVAYLHPDQLHSGPIHSMNTPPYGEMYPYENPVSAGGDPMRPNGTLGHGQPGGRPVGGGSRGPRHAYPSAAGYRDPYDSRPDDGR